MLRALQAQHPSRPQGVSRLPSHRCSLLTLSSPSPAPGLLRSTPDLRDTPSQLGSSPLHMHLRDTVTCSGDGHYVNATYRPRPVIELLTV